VARRDRVEGEGEMTIEELERLLKRELGDGEIAAIGRVLSQRHLLPTDERERKWMYFRAIRKARLVELGPKGNSK
jgi:hypothetical protein